MIKDMFRYPDGCTKASHYPNSLVVQLRHTLRSRLRVLVVWMRIISVFLLRRLALGREQIVLLLALFHFILVARTLLALVRHSDGIVEAVGSMEARK